MDKAHRLFKGGRGARNVKDQPADMKFLQRVGLAMLLLLAGASVARVDAAALQAALFPVEFDDTSMEAPTPAELARVKAVGMQLRDLLTRSGRYDFVDAAPVAAAANQRDLYTCHGCETALATQVGARVSVVAWVQKVSDLILNINAVIRDADSGKVIAAGSVDIRGNTDLSWSRGVSYLVKNRLLAQPASTP